MGVVTPDYVDAVIEQRKKMDQATHDRMKEYFEDEIKSAEETILTAESRRDAMADGLNELLNPSNITP